MEELKEGWRRVRLGDVIESISDTTKIIEDEVVLINTSDVYDGKVLNHQLVENKGLKGQFKKRFKYGDILYSEIRPINRRFAKIKFDSTNYLASTKLMILRKKENTIIDEEYIYQLLKSDKIISELQQIAESRSGTFPQITFNELKTLEFFLPSLEIQKKITSILSSLDEKIELNRKINQNLEETAQTLFKRWFIDFEFLNEEGKPYKSSGGKMIESELGEIPEGWRVGKLGEIVEINPKENLKKLEKKIYVEMKCLSETSSIISEYYEREFTGTGTKFKNKDTLMARITPCLENRKIGYVNFLKDNDIGWGSTEFNILRSQNNIPKELSYFIARSKNFLNYAISNMNGSSGRQRVNGKILEEYNIVISPENIYKKFGKVSNIIMNKIENNRKEIEKLIKLRDYLLPRLMSGEIDVNNLKIFEVV